MARTTCTASGDLYKQFPGDCSRKLDRKNQQFLLFTLSTIDDYSDDYHDYPDYRDDYHDYHDNYHDDYHNAYHDYCDYYHDY